MCPNAREVKGTHRVAASWQVKDAAGPRAPGWPNGSQAAPLCVLQRIWEAATHISLGARLAHLGGLLGWSLGKNVQGRL